jgi:hypothetical protein
MSLPPENVTPPPVLGVGEWLRLDNPSSVQIKYEVYRTTSPPRIGVGTPGYLVVIRIIASFSTKREAP